MVYTVSARQVFIVKNVFRFMFIHSFASSILLLLRGAPDYSIDTVSELTRQSATGNYE